MSDYKVTNCMIIPYTIIEICDHKGFIMYYNRIGENIKSYRDASNITQAHFAERLGLTSAAISAYENGLRMPSYDILVRIADILGVTIDALLGRDISGKIMLDVSELTPEQRKIIRRTVEIFEAYNQSQAPDKENSSENE